MSHWQAKTKIRYTDTLWTKYIKIRDRGRCMYRFKCSGYEGHDCSHFQGRRKETVRHDDENTDLACRVCHNFVHTAEGAKVLEAWKLKQLGQQRYNRLILRANQTGKRDDFMTKLIINQKIKDLENERIKTG